MPLTLANYPDLDFYQRGLSDTGNSYARGDQTVAFIAPVLYNANRPAKIELTVVGSLAVESESIAISSPVDLILHRSTPIAVGATLGTDDTIDGIVVVAETTVIPAGGATTTAVPILPYTGTLIAATSTAAVYEGLVPCLSVEEATFPQTSADTTMTQNKAQGPWKTSDVTTRSWTSNINGALYRQDPAIPLLIKKGQGSGKVYLMVTQAPYDEFSDGNGGLLRYGAGPGAVEGLVTIGNLSITDARSENQKISCALTGDGLPSPYSILLPDF
jgi:hypothetical protein